MPQQTNSKSVGCSDSAMDANRPDLSITIVSFNTRDLTRECLESIYENTSDISFDIWLVDNNSSDGSADMVASEFPSVHLIRNSDNKGLAAATNQGLEASAGRYVLALNSDTIVQPSAFDRLVQFMDEHPEAGGATPKLVLPGGGKHPNFFGVGDNFRWAMMEAISPASANLRDNIVPGARDGAEADLSVTQQVPCVTWGTSFIVRRETVEQIGVQDPRYFVYGEDVDWSIRMTRAGWKLYYVSDAVVVHHGGQSTKQASARMQAQLMKSRCRLIQRHFGFLKGLTLRATIALVCAVRMSKWLILIPMGGARREKSAVRVSEMWSTIRAVLTY